MAIDMDSVLCTLWDDPIRVDRWEDVDDRLNTVEDALGVMVSKGAVVLKKTDWSDPQDPEIPTVFSLGYARSNSTLRPFSRATMRRSYIHGHEFTPSVYYTMVGLSPERFSSVRPAREVDDVYHLVIADGMCVGGLCNTGPDDGHDITPPAPQAG